MIQDLEMVTLITPRKVTAGGVTGAAWIDLQGYDTEHGIKALFAAGIGATPGTCGGYIQASDSSTGASAATVLTFTTKTSAGGSEEKHFSTIKRYVKFIGTAEAAKQMLESCHLVLRARYRP